MRGLGLRSSGFPEAPGGSRGVTRPIAMDVVAAKGRLMMAPRHPLATARGFWGAAARSAMLECDPSQSALRQRTSVRTANAVPYWVW
jgi:hypothetical protein